MFVTHDFPYNGVVMAVSESLRRCIQWFALHKVRRGTWSSSSASPPLHRRLLFALTQRFYDVEILLRWMAQRRRKRLLKKNAYYAYTESLYGRHIAAAYFILCMKGGFRYAGQSEWFRAGKWGKFNWDFLNHRDTPLEEVNLSYTPINYKGLDNLRGQLSLRTLSLRGCPEVDGWFLCKLHMLQDSLEELDISHCPRLTTEGLAALRHLKGLRRLNVSCLRGISNPGLVVILLEEMLPLCQITATGYDFSLRQERGASATAEVEQAQQWESEGTRGPESSERAFLHHRPTERLLSKEMD